MSRNKPRLYHGLRIPFDSLEPEPFASFVHGALHEIGAGRGWTNFQQSDVGPDGGFDSFAENETGGGVCIQCKRYSVISIPEVGRELAKVAMTAAIEKLTISEHLIVSSGKAREALRKALREANRATLRARAVVEANGEELQGLRERASDAGIDVTHAVQEYVDEVTPIVWSGQEFDVQLGLVWPRIQSLVERTFTIYSVVREHPRPDFDEAEYRQGCESRALRRWIQLSCEAGALPANVRGATAGDPLADRGGSSRPRLFQSPQMVEKIVASAPAGAVQFLVGEGGAGKSTTLERIRSSLLNQRRSEKPNAPLPVIVHLGTVLGTLDESIQAALHVKHGHWSAIPGHLLLLLDGIEDMAPAILTAMSRELKELGPRVSVVVTSRSAGPQAPVVIPSAEAWHVRPLGPSEVAELVSLVLDRPAAAAFVDAWLQAAGNDMFVRRPQAVAAALRVWQTTGALPVGHRALLEAVLVVSREREEERASSLPEGLAGVPVDTATDLMRRIVERTWFRDGVRQRTETEFRAALVSSLKAAKTEGVFGADGLTSTDVELLLKHLGLVTHEAQVFQLPHETICNYLTSDRLAKSWRRELDRRQQFSYDPAWRAAASLIPKEEQAEFLNTVGDIDVLWMTTLAVETGNENLVLDRLLNVADKARTSFKIAVAAAALAKVRKARATAKLREWAGREDAVYKNNAVRALAGLGDLTVLRAIRTEVDRHAGTSLKVSGGDSDHWGLAPFAQRLQVAREAVDTSTSGRLAGSFAVLRDWGDSSDADRIDDALLRTEHELASWQRGVQALHRFDRGRARGHLEAQLEDRGFSDRVYVVELAAGLGERVDVEYLVDIVVTAIDETPPPYMLGATAAEYRQARAGEVLARAAVPDDQLARLVSALDDADSGVRSCAICALKGHTVPTVVERARDALARPGESTLGLDEALLLLVDHPVDPELARFAFDAFQGTLDALAFDWASHRVYEMCQKAGLNAEAEAVKNRVGGLIRKALSDFSQDQVNPRPLDAQLALSRWGEVFATDLGPVGGAAEVLSWDLDGIGGSGIPSLIRGALTALEPTDRIGRVSSLSARWRAKVLRWAAEDPEVAAALAPEIIQTMQEHRLTLQPSDLIDAAGLSWNDVLAKGTVEALSSIYQDNSSISAGQRAFDLVNKLGQFFTERQVELYVRPALDAANAAELRGSLQFIYELAHRRR